MNNIPKMFYSTIFRRWPSIYASVNSCVKIQTKTLYSPASLGIDTYEQAREKTFNQFASSEDKFKLKMAEFSEEGSKHMIFTEDLKSVVHLAENTENDLSLVRAMIRKFNQQNKELRFGSFVFGPVIMRMYHFLNQPLEALASFKDEGMTGIFDQLISYHILMDLLFTNELYDEVLEVFQIIKDKQLQPHRYPRSCVALFYAACYKINTTESFKKASEVWQDLKNVGHNPTRRATTFAAALALKQGAPHVALEILSTEMQQNYVTIRNLKAWSLANLGRPDDILPILRSVLNIDDPFGRKHTFTAETMEQVREAMSRCSDKETVAEFTRIDKQLIAHDLISNDTIDSFLLKEITPSQQGFGREQSSQRTQMLSGSYNRRGVSGSGGGSRFTRQRPGLVDMN